MRERKKEFFFFKGNPISHMQATKSTVILQLASEDEENKSLKRSEEAGDQKQLS